MSDVIKLTLPYPISANRYWASRCILVNGRWTPSTYVTTEAKAYRAEVAAIVRANGIRAQLPGRVEVGVQLFPHLPKDWATRQRKLGQTWDDTVQCIDLDNANKVLLDSIKGLVIVDDGWPLRKITLERMVPDGEARVELYVRPRVPAIEPDLFTEVA